MVVHRLTFLNKQPPATKSAGFSGTCILIVAIACHILCLSTPYYFTLSDSAVKEVVPSAELQNVTFDVHYGLWAICVQPGNTTNGTECFQIVSANATEKKVVEPDWLVAPRVLSIVGLLVAVTGVLSVIAFVLTTLNRMPQLFLATAAIASIVGGILILSSDIAFAAEKTISFYAESPAELYLFPPDIVDPAGEARLARIQKYDNRFSSGWSFILDLISGALCIVAGPCFVFVAWRMQLAKDTINKQPGNGNVYIYHGRQNESKM